MYNWYKWLCDNCEDKGYTNEICDHCKGTGESVNDSYCRTCLGTGEVKQVCIYCNKGE